MMTFNLLVEMNSIALLAYLDPGLGSMQLQIMIAALSSASFYLKSSFVQAKGLIGRIWKKKD